VYLPFGKPPLSVKYAVLKQPLAPPEVTCPTDLPFIRTVTLPPQMVIPPEVTCIAKLIGFPFVKVGRGGLLKPVAAIEVAIFPDAVGVGVAVGFGDAVGVEDALALGDGVTLGAAVLTADEPVVVVAAVVDVVFVLATCGLV
jgi:hypothetical protein